LPFFFCRGKDFLPKQPASRGTNKIVKFVPEIRHIHFVLHRMFPLKLETVKFSAVRRQNISAKKRRPAVSTISYSNRNHILLRTIFPKKKK
jgi:hypothetical protein